MSGIGKVVEVKDGDSEKRALSGSSWSKIDANSEKKRKKGCVCASLCGEILECLWVTIVDGDVDLQFLKKLSAGTQVRGDPNRYGDYIKEKTTA